MCRTFTFFSVIHYLMAFLIHCVFIRPKFVIDCTQIFIRMYNFYILLIDVDMVALML